MVSKGKPIGAEMTWIKRSAGMLRHRRLVPRWLVATVVACLLGSATCVNAGGGPENVLLVVNPRRADSLTIANHYASLRQIPSSNIFYLDWAGTTDFTGIEAFRAQILEPIFAEIDRRRLEGQIDYIVYSAGFPFGVDFASDFPAGTEPVVGSRGSLTGLTYLHQPVRNHETSYVFRLNEPRNNYYESSVTHGFSSRYGWNAAGQQVRSGGRNYCLSVMLGYTDGRGNTVDEILNYLQRAALADGSQPPGKIYLMKMDGEVRSTTRDSVYPQVLAAIQQEGVGVEVQAGVIPSSKKDVAGLITGRANLDWNRSRCEIVPGAICEHLTSFGGDLRASAGQTPFTEHLRFGAAGSSGTVVEPFALQAKFPHPMMQLHYVRGASLAEAFYQSLASPYQLLIAGDPLCRPWAKIPVVTVPGIESNQTVSGLLRLNPNASDSVPVKEFRLFVDGRLIETCQPGGEFQIDTTKVGDGHHELRLVGIENSPIESQGRLILPVVVNNHGRSIATRAVPTVASSADTVKVQVSSPGARTVFVFHNRRPLGRLSGSAGSISVDPRTLGRGPISLTAVAIGAKPTDKVFSAPIEIVVEDRDAALSIPVGRR